MIDAHRGRYATVIGRLVEGRPALPDLERAFR